MSYVVQQTGMVRTIRDGAIAEPFLELRRHLERRRSCWDGVAPTRHRARVNFTDVNGHTVVARFTPTGGVAGTATPSSALARR